MQHLKLCLLNFRFEVAWASLVNSAEKWAEAALSSSCVCKSMFMQFGSLAI